MTQQRVLQFEYQQSLVQDSDSLGWSENVTVSVRLLSEAITTGWYRVQFASRGNDFVILMAISLHARPLKGDDLKLLVNLHMATPNDEGRLYARISDVALADELGLSRMTIARATERLAKQKSIAIVEIPEQLTAFRDSHGRFSGTKVYLIAGGVQSRFLDKSVEKLNRAIKSGTVGDHHDSKYRKPAPNSRINVIDDEDDEEAYTALVDRVFSYFAERKGDPDYYATLKEQEALEKLIRDGFTFEHIVAGIEAAFTRPSRPKYFTHCAAITRDLVRLQQEYRTRETRQPETRASEALEQTDQLLGSSVKILETHLARAVEVYRSSGREITNDLLVRFRLMAARCDRVARASGANGGDWLTDALTRALGVAQPGNLLNYADAVLSDWISNGRNENPSKRAPKNKTAHRKFTNTNREPAVHVGIREYLKKHGGIPIGDRD
ncbi:MAG: hypothetical protein WAM09_15090 [Anaerolineales bacterium]